MGRGLGIVVALIVLQFTAFGVETIGELPKNSPLYDYQQNQHTQAQLTASPSIPVSAPQNTVDETKKEESSLFSNIKSTKDRLLATAYQYMGMKYSFGANKGTKKTDCSLFAQRVFDKFGVDLPRSAAQQSALGSKVAKSNLQPGDLLFYRTYKKAPSHVAIYIGNGQMIHASYQGRRVMTDSIEKPYYQKRFLFAKRIDLRSKDHKLD